MGAGVIPFATYNQQVHFLFQTVFSGRKTGYFIDFGGGLNEGETHQQTAAREFIEETETMFFSHSIEAVKSAKKTPSQIACQLPIMTKLFDHTLQKHPNWWCQREPGNKTPPKDWVTFFIEVNYQDVNAMNQEWKQKEGRQTRFSKRRELHWVNADQLLNIYEHHPEKLWKRVRQLVNARAVIQEIKQEKSISPIP